MPLSEHEQRLLDQIESALYAEDPKFASNVRGTRVRTATRRRRLQAAVAGVLGLVVMVAGIVLERLYVGGFPVLSVVGFLVLFLAVVVVVTGRGPRGSGGGAGGTGDAGSTPTSPKPPTGFSSRMEERFKRRFDQQ